MTKPKKTISLTHIEMQRRLAEHLRHRIKPPMVFTEVALEGSWGSMGRMDVVTLQTAGHYTKHSLWGYEVKATRPDLLRDLDTRKFEKYLGPLDQFFFVFPVGIGQPDEVPDPCGVIIYYPETGVWRTAKRAKKLDAYGKGPDMSTFARLLWRAHDMAWQLPKETRLERMERFQKERDLRYSLSGKAQQMIQAADAKKTELEGTILREREQLARERTMLEGADKLLGALRSILRHAQQSLDSSPWASQEANASAIIALADSLEQEVHIQRRREQEARFAST